jgi:bisphosphoglycerate-dependent phosphoglycerate mutase
MTEHLLEQGDVNLIGTREEPRIAEQQFGNFQSEFCNGKKVMTGFSISFLIFFLHHLLLLPNVDPRKVRTAKIERRTFGRFFYRFPNGEAGLDVYNRVSSFLATVSRDLLQFQDSGADMSKLNIVIVTHGLTLRLLLMRYFQLSVEEFEESYNPQNAKLVVLDRIDPVSDESSTETGEQSIIGKKKSFFRLQDEAKDALNLKGDVSSEKPVFFRGDAMDQVPYDLDEEI